MYVHYVSNRTHGELKGNLKNRRAMSNKCNTTFFSLLFLFVHTIRASSIIQMKYTKKLMHLTISFFSVLLPGAVLVGCLMQIAVIWICHVLIIFSTVICPFHYMMFSSKNRMRYIHIVIVIMAIAIPATSVAVMFGTGGFINARFPPLLCLPRNADAGFYAVVLPISLITPIGVSLLLAVFYTTHKVCMHIYLMIDCILWGFNIRWFIDSIN